MGWSLRESLYLVKEWITERKRCIAIPFLVFSLYGLSIGINMFRYTRGVYALYPLLGGNVLLVAKCFVGIVEVSFGTLLLPVSRGFVTWLRSTWLRHIIDFDAALSFHAWLAVIGITAATIHGICATASYVNIGRIPLDAQAAVGRIPKDVAGMMVSWNIISGWILFVIACFTFPFAMRWPRQSPWLKDTKLGKVLNNADYFWVTHHILILVFVPLAIMHSIKWTPGFPKTFAPTFQLTWTKFSYYIAAPLMIYLFNRLHRIATASHLALVIDAGVVGGDVLALKMLKPRFFDHKPGQYLFLCCPKISPYEWHPFTITSSPQDSFVSVHIKKAGDWTGDLHDLFKPAGRGCNSNTGGSCQCNTTATVTLKPSAEKKEVLPTVAEDSKPRLRASASVAGPASQDAPASGKVSFIDADGMPVGSRSKRRVSVDVLSHYSEQVLPTAVAARMRRSSAPGYATAAVAVEAAGRESSFSMAMDRLRNVNRMLAGAWDPRAETVIQEAHERLEQFAQQSTAHPSCVGSKEPALTAFTDYNHNSNLGLIVAGTATNSKALAAASSTQGVQAQTAAADNEDVFVPPLLYIDGPFGAPTQDFEHYKVVVLLGTGIGITPMASVLRSLMHDLYDARCENCGTMNRRLCRVMQTKVYVHWVTRSLEGMAWFQDLLSSISNLDVDRVFQFNVHITANSKPTAPHAKAAVGNQIMPTAAATGSTSSLVPTWNALPSDAGARPAGFTSLPGTKVEPLPVNYSYARPDMHKTLQEVQTAHRGQPVGVFFCGPRVMGQQVQRACRKLNAAANAEADRVAWDPEAPACPRPCRLCFHEEIF